MLRFTEYSMQKFVQSKIKENYTSLPHPKLIAVNRLHIEFDCVKCRAGYRNLFLMIVRYFNQDGEQHRIIENGHKKHLKILPTNKNIQSYHINARFT